jgi:uncharacterized RDD family membrane protein YckC
MAKLLRIVEDHKADKGVRFANYLIDIAFTFMVVLSVSFVIGVIIALTSTSVANEISDEIDNNNSLLDNLLGMLLLVSVMFFSEFITKGRSLGKYITGTIVVKTDATPLTLKDYFIRNICRAIPFDAISFLGNNGWHDSISDTRVVNKKSYENAQKLKKDLDSLGTSLQN